MLVFKKYVQKSVLFDKIAIKLNHILFLKIFIFAMMKSN